MEPADKFTQLRRNQRRPNFDLEDVRARYVRIISLGNFQNDAAAITETDIYDL